MDPLTSAHKITDKKLARMEAHIRAIYRRSGKGLEEDAERILKIFAKQDAAKKAEVAAGVLTNDEYLSWREGAYNQAMHKTRIADKLAKEAVNADKIAVAYVNGELPGIYALNINAVNSAIQNTVGGYSFELLDAHTVRNLMVKYPNLLPLKQVAEKKVERWARSKIGSEILQGLLRGESIPKIAKRLQKITGMQKKYAVTNARTAVTGAENKGRLDGMQEAEQKGVVLEKQWMATHDARTRDWHRALDGVTIQTSEEFNTKDLVGYFGTDFGPIRYPGDPQAHPANVYNCRCTLVTKIIGFKGKNGFVRI